MATRNGRQLASAPSRPRKSLLRTRKLVSHDFDDTSASIGGTLAAHAVIALIAPQREKQSRKALTSRDDIRQAKDMRKLRAEPRRCCRRPLIASVGPLLVPGRTK